MCGRFVGFSTIDQIQTHFGIDKILSDQIRANFNVAPTQQIATIVQEGSKRTLELMHWGLVPIWAKDLSIGNKMINARSETAAEKPAFKAAFRKRRCLIVNDGFFEWMGSKGKKQPMFIKPYGEDGPFAFAGLWEVWMPKDKKNSPLYKSCTILTTEAAESLRPIHHRMPVVLKPKSYGPWLDQAKNNPVEIKQILGGHLYSDFESHPVSTAVNKPLTNDPTLIQSIR